MLPACVSEDLDAFISRYPFTEDAIRRLDRAGVKVEDLAGPEGKELVNAAVKFLEELLTRGERATEPVARNAVDVVLMHLLTAAAAAYLNPRAWRRIADAESKLFSGKLAREDSACIIYVAEGFSMHVEPTGRVAYGSLARFFDFGVSVWDYLRRMPRNDPYWSLGSRPLVGGYVLVRRNDLVRLVEEAVEARVMELIKSFNSEREVISKIMEPAMEVLNNLQERTNIRYEPANVKVTTLYPPCIDSVLKEMKNGGNPSHMARFAYAAFMINALTDYDGLSLEDAVEQVVNDFRTVADFSEKVTRYQVEHIAGARGGRNKYLPPSCQEMNSLGLCPTNLGCGTKNPLQYYAKSRLTKLTVKQGQKGET